MRSSKIPIIRFMVINSSIMIWSMLESYKNKKRLLEGYKNKKRNKRDWTRKWRRSSNKNMKKRI